MCAPTNRTHAAQSRKVYDVSHVMKILAALSLYAILSSLGCHATTNSAKDSGCLVIVEATCKEGHGPDMLALFEQMIPDTRSFQGSEDIRIYVDQDNPDVITWVEYWTSRSEYEIYLKWRMADGAVPGLGEHLAAPITIRFFGPTDF
jgi:quinol monooxygenase YgiN